MGADGFEVGQVWTKLPERRWRWRVIRVDHEGRGVLRSCTTEWATTIPLSFSQQVAEGWVVDDPEVTT